MESGDSYSELIIKHLNEQVPLDNDEYNIKELSVKIILKTGEIIGYCFIREETLDKLVIIEVQKDLQEHIKVINKDLVESIKVIYMQDSQEESTGEKYLNLYE
ncbi:hypothetical protein [Methanobrevibacter sp. DSM 116169]|uniref:hypothetical protein n=1 Tax=Methanobrevibacter sp. DSM 116169 TaxID=3242727 RepID=UPI0038FC4849